MNETNQLSKIGVEYTLNIEQDITKYEKTKLLYITPEQIVRSKLFQTILTKLSQNKQLTRFVIKSAHCISQKGYDFRVDYAQLPQIFSQFQSVPITLVTSTINQAVVQDIISRFGVDAEQIKTITNNFERPNLTLEVIPKKDNVQEVVDYLTEKKLNEKTGVIVCLSKLDCEKVFQKLTESGFSSTLYHASLSSEERQQNMSNWIDGTVKILIGTVALGVPKRKEPVQFIIHYKLPRSLEEYFVLNGIVGRNGDCTSVIMYNNTSFKKMHMILQGMDDTELKKMNEYCKNETICRHQALYSHFERVVDKCGSRCDVCQQDKS
jgi:bloom syndrome protein